MNSPLISNFTSQACRFFCMVWAVCILYSCGGKPSDTNEPMAEADTSLLPPGKSLSKVSVEALDDMLQSIPPPVEMAALLKESGAEYNRALLNPPENIEIYNTSLKKALNLGIYGADLGYINIYEKTNSALSYLNCLKRLADDLKVGQFLDYNTLKRLATNSHDVDSLLNLTTSSLNDIDAYLREQKRGSLSALMITGAWVECLHISCQVIKEKPIREIEETIGEQKPILENLILILSLYKSDPYFANILSHFELLKTEFNKVKITYEYRPPVSKEINGQLVVEDNSSSTVHITEEMLKKITDAIERTRDKMVEFI